MLTSLFLLSLSTVGVPQDDATRTATHLRFLWQDVDGDGRRDALVIDRRGAARLLIANGEGDFADRTVELGLGRLGPVREAVWGDAEGDGRPELIVVGARGEARLLAADASGAFGDVTTLAGLPAETACTLPEWLDFDADGHTDLMLHTEGSALLFRGDGAGSFLPVELGLPAAAAEATTPAVFPRSGVDPDTEVEADSAPSAEPADEVRGRVRPAPGSGGRYAASVPTITPGTPPSGGTVPVFGPPSGICASSVLDQALSGCLKASSVPVLGMLYPLGSELFIEAGSGDVGLGTLNPESSLHVATGGDVSLSGGGYLQLGSQSGKNIGIDDNEIMARNGGAPGQLFLNIDGGNVMVGNSSSNGKFGVGTTSPQYDVHVRGDGTTGSIQVTPNVANANAELRLAENTSASLGMLMRYNGTANDLEVRGVNSGGETGVHFFVDRDSGVAGFPTSSARVGIGTASPSGLLHVAGSGGDGSVVLPGDTIGSAEIFGEMGLASDIGSSVITLTSSGDTNLAKRVITTPTSGHVLALGSVQHNNLNLFLEAKLALHIEWTEGAKQTDTVLVDQPSGLLDHTFVQGIFAVGPGTQTISLVGTSFNLDIEAYDPVLTLIFIPTTYGQVDAH